MLVSKPQNNMLWLRWSPSGSSITRPDVETIAGMIGGTEKVTYSLRSLSILWRFHGENVWPIGNANVRSCLLSKMPSAVLHGSTISPFYWQHFRVYKLAPDSSNWDIDNAFQRQAFPIMISSNCRRDATVFIVDDKTRIATRSTGQLGHSTLREIAFLTGRKRA